MNQGFQSKIEFEFELVFVFFCIWVYITPKIWHSMTKISFMPKIGPVPETQDPAKIIFTFFFDEIKFQPFVRTYLKRETLF